MRKSTRPCARLQSEGGDSGGEGGEGGGSAGGHARRLPALDAPTAWIFVQHPELALYRPNITERRGKPRMTRTRESKTVGSLAMGHDRSAGNARVCGVRRRTVDAAPLAEDNLHGALLLRLVHRHWVFDVGQRGARGGCDEARRPATNAPVILHAQPAARKVNVDRALFYGHELIGAHVEECQRDPWKGDCATPIAVLKVPPRLRKVQAGRGRVQQGEDGR